MKTYFENEDDEYSHTKEYFIEKMRTENLSEVHVFEAKKVYGTGFFWCEILDEIGESGESCGKLCEHYSPRNGKNGICKHSFLPVEPGKKITLKL